jgi:hypothetical protein
MALQVREGTQLDNAAQRLHQCATGGRYLSGMNFDDLLNQYWTRTAWRDRGVMGAFVAAQPHLATMGRIDEWCDEATFVDWDQPGADLPDWQESYRRIVADGQVSNLTNPSAANSTREFPAPVVPS